MQFKKTVIAVKELHRFYRHSLLHLEKWNFHWPSVPSREHPATLALARKPSSKSTYHEQGRSQSLMKSQDQMSGGGFGWRSPNMNQLKPGNHCKSRRWHPEVNICKSKAHSIPTAPLQRLLYNMQHHPQWVERIWRKPTKIKDKKKKNWNEKDYQGKKAEKITSPTILFCCVVEPLVGNLAAITQRTQGPAQQYCSCSDKRNNKKKEIRCEMHKQAFICSVSLSLKLRDSQDWGFSRIFRFNWEFSHPVNLLNISIY